MTSAPKYGIGGNSAVAARRGRSRRARGVTRRAIAYTSRQISANSAVCASATGSWWTPNSLIDSGDEHRIHGRADDFGHERRRVGKARELAGRREHLAEPAIAVLVGPLRRPVGPLIPDEEQAVQRRRRAQIAAASGETVIAEILRAAARDTARRCRRRGDRCRSARRPSARAALAHARGAASRSASSAITCRRARPRRRPAPAGRRAPLSITSRDAADVGADAGHAGRQALDQRDRRAFVARRQQEHVGRAVDRREIAAPAEKPHAIARCRAPRAAASSSRAQLAVAGDQEHAAGSCAARPAAPLRETAACCLIAVSRPTVVTTCAVRPECRARRARGSARASSIAASAIEIEPERHDAVLIGAADAMLLAAVRARIARRDGDDAIGDAGERRARCRETAASSPRRSIPRARGRDRCARRARGRARPAVRL